MANDKNGGVPEPQPTLDQLIQKEANLGENWHAVEAPPVIPGQGGNRFLEGSLPSFAQLDTDFAKVASTSPTTPRLSLMPLGSSTAQNNSAIQSVVEQAVEVATQAATEAAASVPGDMIWSGTWLNFAVYELDDVVFYNNSTWIALQVSKGLEPDINPTAWALLAKYSGGVNQQTGTTYELLSSDNGQLVTFDNATAIAVSLPVATTPGFSSGWYVDVQNIGAVGNGWVTITPVTSAIDGQASVTVQCGSGLRIFSDGTNYKTNRGGASLTLDNLDDTSLPRTAQYFRPAQYTTDVCVDNASFQASAFLVNGAPPGWYSAYPTTSTCSYNTATPYAQGQCLQLTVNSSSEANCAQCRVITLVPGETYEIGGWVKSDGTHTAGFELIMTNWPITTSAVIQATTTSASWVYVSQTGTVPTTNVSGPDALVLGIACCIITGAAPGATASFQNTRLHRIFGASGTYSSPGLVPDPGASAGSLRYLREDQTWQVPPGGSGGGGTVTSVAMTVPSWLSVAGSPITGGGTLAVSATGGLTQNSVLATPDGAAGALSVRSLVVDDIPALPASQITSGELSLARGGTGSDLSATGGTSYVLKQVSSGADVTVGQLAFTDISGSVAASQLPNPTASTLGGIESIAATAHEWIDSISTLGVPHQSQPAYTDLTGTLDNVPEGLLYGKTPVSAIGASNPSGVVGYQVVSNPDFQTNLAGYSVYDNNSTGNVSLTRVLAASAVPNGFGYVLEIKTVTGAAPSPGLGGFYYNLSQDSGPVAPDTYHVGDTYIIEVLANIPIGFTLEFASNSLGTGGSATWLSTSTAGTGAYQKYVIQVVVGTSPATSDAFPFFYLTGTAPVTWYVASLQVTDIDQPQRVLSFSNISGAITAAQEPATTVNSVVDDTNVTGSIASQVLTLAWSGTLWQPVD
jgi:hypothetical protein